MRADEHTPGAGPSRRRRARHRDSSSSPSAIPVTELVEVPGSPWRRPIRTAVDRVRQRREVIFLASVGLIAQLLAVISGPLVARMVGPEGRGEIVTVTLVTVLSAFVCQGGYPAAVTRAVAAAGLPARDVLRGRLLRGAASCLVPAVGGAAVAAYLLRDSDYRWTLVVEAFLTSLLTALSRLSSAMLQGEGSVRGFGGVLLIGTAGYVVLIAIAFVFFRNSPPPVIVAFFIASLLYSLIIGLRYLKPPVGDPTAVRATSDMRQFAWRSVLSGVALVDGLGFDHLLVAIVLGQTQLGLFAVAASAANVPTVALSPIAAMLLSRMAAQRSAEQAQHVMRQWVLGSLVLDVLVVVALEIALGPAIRIAFGAAFVPAITAARVLTLAWGLFAFRKVLNSVAQAQGRAFATSVIEIVAAVVLVGTAVPFMHRWGIEGAGYSMLAAAVIAFVGLVSTVRWSASAQYETASDVNLNEVATISAGDGALS